MARNETSELKLAALGEFPEQVEVLRCGYALCVRLVMFHVWKLLHFIGVFAILRSGSEGEFMRPGAFILKREVDLLSAAHLDARRLEELLVPVLAHCNFYNARGLFWIAGLAGRE